MDGCSSPPEYTHTYGSRVARRTFGGFIRIREPAFYFKLVGFELTSPDEIDQQDRSTTNHRRASLLGEGGCRRNSLPHARTLTLAHSHHARAHACYLGSQGKNKGRSGGRGEEKMLIGEIKRPLTPLPMLGQTMEKGSAVGISGTGKPHHRALWVVLGEHTRLTCT